ncbi:hypothetical protein [Clostridium sp.]|uniref:hypothetical protein n=1 Tax=Clostridium sp. TaxID=1506 RepID=UPI001EB7CABE|nr:hypothetical protein [Clostridium sp.]MBS5886679.1 hypothetical protein [Clostridium sp.]
MEFITVEQFQEQPVEVQKVFLDWWRVNRTDADLVLLKTGRDKFKLQIINNIDMVCVENDEITPLFTEGQLRKFIEDKSNGIVKLIQWHIEDSQISKRGYAIDILRKNEYHVTYHYKDLGEDLLKAYWKVACSVAKEEVDG